MRKLNFFIFFFMINNLSSFLGQETEYRSKRGVRVVRKKVRVDTKEVVEATEESAESDSPREGRHLGLLADLYLRLQCADRSCQARPETAQLCCLRNFNLNCCSFSPLPSITQSIFNVRPAGHPFSVGVSLGVKPPQQFPPVYPFQQDHFLPSDQYHPHSQEDHHQQSHDHNHHGSIRPLHNYKPGLCPHQDEDFFKGPIFHGVHNDIPIVPGTSYSSSATCTYDTDCRGTSKCCHVRVRQHRLVMECRYPLQHGHETNNWKWRTLESENVTRNIGHY